MPESSQERFGRVAERYLTSKDHALPDGMPELVERLEPMDGLVLDVGTGAGHTAYALAKRAAKVVAVDITPEMLKVVEREASERGLTNIDIVQAPAENLPFEDGAAVGLACRLAAHHFGGVDSFVRECARVVKPGGWVLLIDTVSPEDMDAAKVVNHAEAIRDPSHGRNLSPSEWRAIYEEAGFEIEAEALRDKRLDYMEWMDRQDVPESDRPDLDRLIMNSTGAVRDYFKPETGDRPSFALQELTLIARRK
jgi:ubiquinone/menaquinone biosynthesis C-methylase UbiE